MPRISFSPEGRRSLGKLPNAYREKFNVAFSLIQAGGPRAPTLDTHPLSGRQRLRTLRIGSYRGVFHWDGEEARFIRFGHCGAVYLRLPKS
jgi:mRNA-degrading endonuclease RelE of RelBE toxin-antitoxin system